jgi:hypothetical protein
MTLCVAAECEHEGKARFVFAKDFEVETEIASAEIEAKWTRIGKADYPALMAGSGSRAIELADEIGQRLDGNDSDNESFVQIARFGVKEFKYKLADEVVASRLGIGYDRFLAEGARMLPSEVHREMLDAINAMTLGCSLLWLPFDANNGTHIVRIHDSGMVETCSHFAAIGSGMYIAESSLFQREQSNEKTLGDTVYHIYEAMKLGSAAPGVGKSFSLHIVSPPAPPSQQVRMHWITEDYDKYMERMFAKFGPKKTSGILYRSRFVKLNKFGPTGSQQ